MGNMEESSRPNLIGSHSLVVSFLKYNALVVKRFKFTIYHTTVDALTFFLLI
jgi:hypothetical protein